MAPSTRRAPRRWRPRLRPPYLLSWPLSEFAPTRFARAPLLGPTRKKPTVKLACSSSALKHPHFAVRVMSLLRFAHAGRFWPCLCENLHVRYPNLTDFFD